MRKKISKIFFICIFLIVALIWTHYGALPDGKLHVHALDVGQGDAIFVRMPGGKIMLIDGGPKTYVLERLNEVMGYFEHTIDYVVLTHPHADHIDGLVEVIKRYDIGKILFTGVDYTYPTYDEFIQVLVERNIPFEMPVATNDFYSEPDVFVDILYPLESLAGVKVDNVNNSSVALKLIYDGTSVLLTGDAEEEEEHEILLSGVNLKADIYKAGHHGSRTATSPEFFEQVKPDMVFICAGQDNQFDHPHPETMDLLEEHEVETHVTKDVGTIKYSSDGIVFKIQD